MAALEEAIYAKLTGDAAVSAIVGARVYPIKAPDNPTYPFVTYQRIYTNREHTLDPSVQSAFATVTLQVDCWASETGKYSQVKDLAKKVRTALDDVRGALSGVDVQGILSENEVDLWEQETETYRTMQTYKVIVKE